MAGLIGAGTVAVTIAQAHAPTRSDNVSIEAAGLPIGADEIRRTVIGKTCTTKAGATFTFTNDGHYSYVGLWANQGHYKVNDGAVTVLFDSGLERQFAISRKESVVYMEETALSCR